MPPVASGDGTATVKSIVAIKEADETINVSEADQELKPLEEKVKAEESNGSGKHEVSPVSKRSKRSCVSNQQSIKSMFAKMPVKKKAKDEAGNEAKKIKLQPKLTRCTTCNQNLDSPDLVRYETHPDGAKEELEVLFDERVRIQSDGEQETDALPQYRVTGFTMYDLEGHVTRIDTDLIDKDKHIYMSGYVKAIYDQDPGIEGGVALKDCGPLTSWFTSGFDGGENALLGVSTESANYFLGQASDLYKPFMDILIEKGFLTKHVIEFLEKAASQSSDLGNTYEDLVNYLELIVPKEGMDPLNNDMLIKHADYIVGQVYSYEDCANEEDYELVTLPALQDLIKIAGIDVRRRKKLSQQKLHTKEKKAMPKHTDATVTPAVRQVFEMMFGDQMRKEDDDTKAGRGKARMKRCGMCDQCLKVDCGVCRHCRDMTKFGGSGKSKQACMERKCDNKSVGGIDLEDCDDDIEVESPSKSKETQSKINLKETTPSKTKTKKKHKDLEWVGKGIKEGRYTYYSSALLDGETTINIDDTVLISPDKDNIPLYIAKVGYMYDGPGGAMVHVQWFGRSIDTILGESGDPAEIFLLTECEDQPLLSIWKHCNVTHMPEAEFDNWRKEGGQEPKEFMQDDGCNFWYRFHYTPNVARFEYPTPLPEKPEDLEEGQVFCGVCCIKKEIEQKLVPQILDKSSDSLDILALSWNGAPLKVGDCVYLAPDSVSRKIRKQKRLVESIKSKDVDPEKYPEYYRKTDYIKGNNNDTADPFQVAIIKRIFKDLGEVKLKVQIFYRPEDTHQGALAGDTAFYNQLYWTEEEGTVGFSKVRGRCYVRFVEFDETDHQLEVWTEEGPDRWWFKEWYNAATKSFEEEPPMAAKKIGQKGKGGKGGKGKGKSSAPKADEKDVSGKEVSGSPMFSNVSQRLKCLDIFSGCGGLSQGLHESGVADSKWAVEIFEPAAKAYKLNNPECSVFGDDCNLLLAKAIAGETENSKKQKIPTQGEVDLLCGGPPCQGFSGMNRFNHGEYSKFKNSLVSTYLSYCDYYRPKFFILENVKNFANFKKGMVLKLCLNALIKMGYQCTFGVLQAGQFGVAQTRRRAIILAAAPGQTLPLYPEPRHCFPAGGLTVQVEGIVYSSNVKWRDSAPYRTCTVRDMMSDLPVIQSGTQNTEVSYGGDPRSHFQRKIRNNSQVLVDHVTKKMDALNEARCSLIPTTPGSDWRDLPNIVMTLSDGTKSKKLQYLYHDANDDRGSKGALRGVCTCAQGKHYDCDPMDKQDKTLIPWCLPHTSARHNQWAGLYGRNDWDGHFSTTITTPCPMGKQGRVLHPDQPRVVSVRECARSQGFPDTYKFYGTITEKYRQIGNAVPPPMGKALGMQIREAMAMEKAKNDK